MQGRGKRASALVAAAIATIAGSAALGPGLAHAQTVTYNSTGPLHVPDETDGVTSTIVVPPGTGPVLSVDVTNFRVSWGASAQELSVQLIGPGGQSLFLFTEGCQNYQGADIWAYSDSAAQIGPNGKFDAKCALPGGTFKPADPQNKKLAIFAGQPASGIWTLRAADTGVQFTNQGDILSWAVRIDHAAAPPAAVLPAPTAAPTRKKCKKGRKLKKGKCVKKKKKKKD